MAPSIWDELWLRKEREIQFHFVSTWLAIILTRFVPWSILRGSVTTPGCHLIEVF